MIRFDEETHRYFDGEKELISTTRLMAKHGLSHDYSGVPEAVLRAKAERGSLIHKEIETYIKTGEIGFTIECWNFADYVEKMGAKVVGSEKIVHNDICAGTVDLFLIDVDGKKWIADIKTTTRIHEDAVSWQLSIYNAMSGNNADVFAVFHFDADGALEVKEIKEKQKEEVDRLFECEREGKMFIPKVPMIVEDAMLEELSDFETIIKQADAKKKEAEEQAKAIKDAILRAMEQNGVNSFESNGMKITLVASSEKKTLDTARLKSELPDIASKYTKTQKTAAYIKITPKEVNYE